MMEEEKEVGVVVVTVEDDSIVEAGCLVVDGEMTDENLEALRQLVSGSLFEQNFVKAIRLMICNTLLLYLYELSSYTLKFKYCKMVFFTGPGISIRYKSLLICLS